MSMGKRPRKDADEYDAFSRYWTIHGYLHRPGVKASIKRRVRRRERRQARTALKQGDE